MPRFLGLLWRSGARRAQLDEAAAVEDRGARAQVDEAAAVEDPGAAVGSRGVVVEDPGAVESSGRAAEDREAFLEMGHRLEEARRRLRQTIPPRNDPDAPQT